MLSASKDVGKRRTAIRDHSSDCCTIEKKINFINIKYNKIIKFQDKNGLVSRTNGRKIFGQNDKG